MPPVQCNRTYGDSLTPALAKSVGRRGVRRRGCTTRSADAYVGIQHGPRPCQSGVKGLADAVWYFRIVRCLAERLGCCGSVQCKLFARMLMLPRRLYWFCRASRELVGLFIIAVVVELWKVDNLLELLAPFCTFVKVRALEASLQPWLKQVFDVGRSSTEMSSPQPHRLSQASICLYLVLSTCLL
jgi:hypothetical protein